MTSRTPARTVAFVNADVPGTGLCTVRIEGERIASVDSAIERGDVVVDLAGGRLLPGLINAHDHLQLNNFPRVKYRERYANVLEWSSQVAARKDQDPVLSAAQAVPRAHRLLAGAAKNLLSGVTTVAHHDPFYETFEDPAYPVRVVADYGWAHSLQLEGDTAVRDSYRATPAAQPWIIHAAEGTDAEARGEYARLVALGCIGENTLIVHGVALDAAEQEDLAARGAGLIWCPASNLHLFGHTTAVAALHARGRVALGSDSRLSGSADFLEELAIARKHAGIADADLETMATTSAARLLRLADRGAIAPGCLADLIVLPRGMQISRATRADLSLVLLDGVVRCAGEGYAPALTPSSQYVQVLLDGRPKLLERNLALQLARAAVREAGLDLPTGIGRAA